jgi:hypothetical protein
VFVLARALALSIAMAIGCSSAALARPAAPPRPGHNPVARVDPSTAHAAALAPRGSLTVAPHQRRAVLLRTGLRFSVACHGACRITYSYAIPAHAQAGRGRPRVALQLLGRGSAALSRTGTLRLAIHLSAAAVAAIRAAPRAVLTVVITDPATRRSRTLRASTTVA